MPKRYRVPGKSRQRHFIKEWRVYRGLTQAQLAERLTFPGASVTAATVSRMETGALPYGQDMLEAIAYALQCEPNDLLVRDPTKEDAIWSIHDVLLKATPAEREQLARVVEALVTKKRATR